MERDKHNNLDRLKGENPFKVPENYFSDLTGRIMDQLPEQEFEKEKPVTLLDRLRPWLYLAAVFAGLGFFFEAIMKSTRAPEDGLPDSLLVQTEVAKDSFIVADEDEDYVDYLEDQYAEILLSEEMSLYSE